MFYNLRALKLKYAMSVYQKLRDCKTAGPLLCFRMIFARVYASHAHRAWQISFSPSALQVFRSWGLDLHKNTGWFTVEKVSFLWSTVYPATFGKKKKITKYRTPRVSTLKHQSLSCLFCTFDKTMSYWILGPLRSTSYKIIVPHTQLAIRWFTQMTKTLKTVFFFIFLPYVPKRPRGKSPELRAGAPGAEGIVRTGRLKLTTNFSMFFLVCVCVCVSEVFVAAWNNSASCFWKSMGIPDFCWCNVSHVLFIFYIKY